MTADLRWIIAQYGFRPGETHIGVPEKARTKLKEMAEELVGTSGLVAIYVPFGTPDGYEPGAMSGRIVGAVRLLQMPHGRRMEDYHYDNLEGERQWPIGWPCKAVYAPRVSAYPDLREHVEHLFGSRTFSGYVARFQHGPFSLEPAMRERLNRDFAQFDPVE